MEMNLVADEQAVICVLLLRGPQTVGEIRSRTERLHAFGSLEEVQETLASLENLSLVVQLPRQPGRKESRYAHLLEREPQDRPVEAESHAEVTVEVDGQEKDRVGDLHTHQGPGEDE